MVTRLLTFTPPLRKRPPRAASGLGVGSTLYAMKRLQRWARAAYERLRGHHPDPLPPDHPQSKWAQKHADDVEELLAVAAYADSPREPKDDWCPLAHYFLRLASASPDHRHRDGFHKLAAAAQSRHEDRA